MNYNRSLNLRIYKINYLNGHGNILIVKSEFFYALHNVVILTSMKHENSWMPFFILLCESDHVDCTKKDYKIQGLRILQIEAKLSTKFGIICY